MCDILSSKRQKITPEKLNVFGVFWHTCRDPFFAHRVSKPPQSGGFSLCDEKAGRGKRVTGAFAIRGFESLLNNKTKKEEGIKPSSFLAHLPGFLLRTSGLVLAHSASHSRLLTKAGLVPSDSSTGRTSQGFESLRIIRPKKNPCRQGLFFGTLAGIRTRDLPLRSTEKCVPMRYQLDDIVSKNLRNV